MKIFSGSSNLELAESLAKKLNISLSPREIFLFPDGERRVYVEEEVVGDDCVVVQSTTPPVDENYMELFFLIDALTSSGAKSVTVVMPYIGYQRQDHIFRVGESASLRVVLTILETLKIDKILFVDPHTIKVSDMLTIPSVSLSALPLFAEEILKKGWSKEDTVLVSPDMGGIRRIRIMSELVDGMEYVTIEKNRDLATGNIEAHHFDGIVKKRCLLVDDMISSGKSMVQAANLMLENGAEEVHAFVTHAIFSSEAPKLLQDSSISTVNVTDSVFLPEEKRFEKLHIHSLAELLSKELHLEA